MSTHHDTEGRTTEEMAFMDYLKNMRNSVGKRFLVHLINENGHEAFEQFWLKMRDAVYQEPPDISLNSKEQVALAKALGIHSRREFLGRAIGLGLLYGGTKGFNDSYHTYYERDGHSRHPNSQEQLYAKCLSALSLLSLTVGMKLFLQEYKPNAADVFDACQGPRSKAHIHELVLSLDAMFKPVELSLHETGARPHR